MSRNRESKMGETPAHIVAANWFNAQALEPVHELNGTIHRASDPPGCGGAAP